jgi:hypothetical protein
MIAREILGYATPETHRRHTVPAGLLIYTYVEMLAYENEFSRDQSSALLL